MSAVLISTKGQIVLPIAVRRALGLRPGTRVDVRVEGKKAIIAPAAPKKSVTLKEIQSLLTYDGPVVPIKAMRVTGYKG